MPADHPDDLRAQAFAPGHAAETDVLLCAARTSLDEGARQRLRERLAGPLDWEHLLRLGLIHGVNPLLYRTLRDEPDVPSEALEVSRGPAHALALMVALRRRTLIDIVGGIERAGVPVLTFKGIAQGASAYGDASLRKPGDVDLLIRAEHYHAVRDLLEGQGFVSRTPRKDEARYLKTRSSITFERPDVEVDLHWTLEQQPFDSFPFALRFDIDAIWAEAGPVDLDGTPVQTLSPEHALLYLCGHGVKHSWALYYSVCDVAETVRAFPDLDWDRVAAEAASNRVIRIYHVGLLLAHGLAGAPVPSDALAPALADSQARRAARAVAGWVFDPDSTVGDIKHGFVDSARYYRHRVDLLERTHEKALYLLYRGLRRFSRKAGQHPDAPSTDSRVTATEMVQA